MTKSLRLEVRPVAGLVFYANNAKGHAPDQVAHIAASIAKFGFQDPIGVTEDGTIVEGHGRYLAAQSLGMTEVPCLVLAGFSERDADLYRIAHNKIALSSGFKFEALVQELRSLDSDIGHAALGFSDAALASLFEMFPADGEASGMKQSSRRPSQLTYEIVWETAEQKKEFAAFVKAIRKRAGDIDVATALVAYVEELGLLSGGMVAPVVSDDEVDEAAHVSI